MKHTGRSGFSLVELLVVIAIVGVLLAIALPAVQQMRQSARNSECKNNLRQIAIGLQNHQGQFGYLPRDGDKGWGYAVYLLPQVEQSALFQSINPNQNPLAAGSSVQPGLTDVVIPVYMCPSFQKDPRLSSGFGRLNYLGNSALLNKKKMQFSDVIDGESTTVAAAEAITDSAWAMPGTTAGSAPSQSGPLGSKHGMGGNFVMCDGAVRWIAYSVDSTVIKALFTIDGNDVVGNF